ncbi:MAG: hypothetical protein PF588_00280 [Candidatus Kapabacteria bacterium]|jgi:predicted hydrocarbon binding protein|nr:hypothetical protein [Candidatus Kapabacteria bacterium]
MAKGLELIGDPAAGRPTLGETVPIALFRALRLVGMKEGLDSMVGDASTLVYTSGKGVGANLGNAILAQTGKDLGKFIEAVGNQVRSLGIGIMEILQADIENGYIEIKVNECVTCSGSPNIGERVCHFESGFISGILEAFIGKTVNVLETKCNCMGEEGCVFEAKF